MTKNHTLIVEHDTLAVLLGYAALGMAEHAKHEEGKVHLMQLSVMFLLATSDMNEKNALRINNELAAIMAGMLKVLTS